MLKVWSLTSSATGTELVKSGRYWEILRFSEEDLWGSSLTSHCLLLSQMGHCDMLPCPEQGKEWRQTVGSLWVFPLVLGLPACKAGDLSWAMTWAPKITCIPPCLTWSLTPSLFIVTRTQRHNGLFLTNVCVQLKGIRTTQTHLVIGRHQAWIQYPWEDKYQPLAPSGQIYL